MSRPAPYLWDFDRSPWGSNPKARTFSVGIFQWLPKASGVGLKKSSTIRVLGYVADPKAVYDKAEELCRRLNEEQVRLDSRPAWLQKQYSLPRPASPFSRASRITAKDRVVQMLREVLEPEMKRRGFRRTGRKFWRNGPTACQVIDFTLSRWGTATAGTFDVFMGVFWHDIEAALRNPSASRMPPPESCCTFRIDLGWATPARQQKSWRADRHHDMSKIGHEILADLLAFGLPWLDYRSNLRHVLETDKYSKPCGKEYRTSGELLGAAERILFQVKLGKIDQAQRAIANWPQRAKEITAAVKRLTSAI